MDSFKSWIFSVCVAAVIISVLSMLSPNGKTEKIMRFTIGLFFVLMISAPVASFAGNYKNFGSGSAASGLDSKNQSSGYDDYNDQVKQLLIKKTEENLSAGIETIGADLNYLSVLINIKQDNCIEISKVKIFLNSEPSKDESRKIIKYIKEKAGTAPEITVKSGGQ